MTNKMNTQTNELTNDELDIVSGGFGFIAAAAYCAAVGIGIAIGGKLLEGAAFKGTLRALEIPKL